MNFPRRDDATSKELILTIIEIQGYLSRYGKSHTNWHETLNEVIERLERAERPQRMRGKGRWNVYYHGEENGKSIFSYSCNQCGYGAPYNFIGGVCEQKKWNFCPNCGADMRGGQDGTT